MPNLENVELYHGEEGLSSALFQDIVHKGSIRRLDLGELAFVPLDFWDKLQKVGSSDTISVSGFCSAYAKRPRCTRPMLVTSVDLHNSTSVQFFIA